MSTRYIAKEYRLAHWAGIMQERMESGLSVRAFCESAGFHENNYYYWQRKLREVTCEELAKIQGRTAGLTPPVFMEVMLPEEDAPPSAAAPLQSQLCIEAAALRITAGCDYPLDKLVAVLREVTRSC